MSESPVIVTLVSLGADVRSFEVSSDPRVEYLLKVANRQIKSGDLITRSGEKVGNNTVLNDGDTIIIGENVKGNGEFQVQLIRLGVPEFDSLTASPGMTIKQMVEQLPSDKRSQYFRADGTDAYEYRKVSGGSPMKSNEIIYPNEDGGTIRLILSQAMKGNIS
jgi:hypothetical protein